MCRKSTRQMGRFDAKILAQNKTGMGLQMSDDLANRLRFAETWDLDADQQARDRCGVLMLEAAEKLEKLQAELEEAQTIDAGLWKWLGERDLQPDGPDVEWPDIVSALDEHENAAIAIADKAMEFVTNLYRVNAEHPMITLRGALEMVKIGRFWEPENDYGTR